jgi:Bacterial protein of unknown function (DUF922)
MSQMTVMKLTYLVVGLSFIFAVPCIDAFGNPPSWEEEIANGHYPYHRLTPADFPINDAVYQQFGMHTEGFFQIHYHDHWTEIGGRAIALIIDWKVWSGFDRTKSSRRSWYQHTAETLTHEQGHLDINELHSKRLADTPLDKLPVGQGTTGPEAEADLARKMKALGERVVAEMHAEQERYDAETNHGKNAEKQRVWSAAIQTRLQSAGIHF